MENIDFKGLSELGGFLLTPGGMALGIWLLFKYLRGMKAEFKKALDDQTKDLHEKISSVNNEIHNNGFVRKDLFELWKEELEKRLERIQNRDPR